MYIFSKPFFKKKRFHVRDFDMVLSGNVTGPCVCHVKKFKITTYTGHTQKNGAVLILFTIKTAPFFCVCPVYVYKIFCCNHA
jgi:hypothetical protein